MCLGLSGFFRPAYPAYPAYRQAGVRQAAGRPLPEDLAPTLLLCHFLKIPNENWVVVRKDRQPYVVGGEGLRGIYISFTFMVNV